MKQVMRKLSLLPAAMMLVCVMSVTAFATAVTVTATVANDTLTVEVSGLTANTQTTLMILPVADETSLPTPSDVEAETNPLTPWYIGQETADANGKFTYTFDVEGKSGKYIAYAGGEGMDLGNSGVFDLSATPATVTITKAEAATADDDIINVPQDMAFADYIKKVKLVLSNETSVVYSEENAAKFSCDEWASIATTDIGGKVTLNLKYKYDENTTLSIAHEVTVATMTNIFVNGENEKVVVNARLVDNSLNGKTIKSLTTSETGYVVLSVSGFDESKKFDGGTISFSFPQDLKLKSEDIQTYSGVTATARSTNQNAGTISFTVDKTVISGTSIDIAHIKISSNSAISNASITATNGADGYIALTRAEGNKSMLKAEVGSAATFKITYTGGGGGGGTGGGGGGGGGGTSTVVPTPTPVVTPTPTAPSTDSTFADVSDHWAKDAVQYVADKGIIKGKGDGNFYPDDTVTRAELTAMAVRALGLAEKTYQGGFADVNADAWYAGIVQAALDAGLISAADVFRPDDLVTREEMSKIFIGIAQALNVLQELPQDYQATFPDMGSVSEWATNYVNIAGYNGLMSGMSDGSFQPRGSATRAESATVISRILQK